MQLKMKQDAGAEKKENLLISTLSKSLNCLICIFPSDIFQRSQFSQVLKMVSGFLTDGMNTPNKQFF